MYLCLLYVNHHQPHTKFVISFHCTASHIVLTLWLMCPCACACACACVCMYGCQVTTRNVTQACKDAHKRFLNRKCQWIVFADKGDYPSISIKPESECKRAVKPKFVDIRTTAFPSFIKALTHSPAPRFGIIHFEYYQSGQRHSKVVFVLWCVTLMHSQSNTMMILTVRPYLLAYSFTYSLTHILTYSLNRILIYSLTLVVWNVGCRMTFA